jgi:hypothetical protein
MFGCLVHIGLGGCPYAGGKASGNVATEEVVRVLQVELGIDCGVQEEGLLLARDFVRQNIKKHIEATRTSSD